MIIPNGTIEFIKAVGGLDEGGYPKQTSKSYGCAVPCQYLVNTRNNIGITNGETFTKAAYTILIEPIPCCAMTRQIRLKDRCGREVGEFPVLNAEPLDAVCQIKIIV